MTILGLTLLATLASDAAAQPALPAGDVTGLVAWQSADARNTDPFDRDDWHSSLFAGVSGGLYWTAHLKTEIDAGASTTTESYRSRPVQAGGSITYQSSLLQASRRTVGLSQQYQFCDNAWLHPHVAAGANLTWERRTEYFSPTFDPAAGGVVPGTERTEGPATTLTVRPFVAVGFKAYMTPRWFVRADSRFAFKRGFEESQVRIGLGRDW